MLLNLQRTQVPQKCVLTKLAVNKSNKLGNVYHGRLCCDVETVGPR
jgi:hypothetical protein